MEKKLSSWFFMRPGFTTFRLDPQSDSRFLFGAKDRGDRDRVLNLLQEAAYSNDGCKAAIYGDFGRGKTHQCHNLIWEIAQKGLPFAPVYVKCGAFRRKEPFNTFFRELFRGHSAERLQEIGDAYQRLTKEGRAPAMSQIVHANDIATVLTAGLGAPNLVLVSAARAWLGGEPAGPELRAVKEGVKPLLGEASEFGEVLRGLSQLFLTVNGLVPLFIVDEAERFLNVTDNDTFWAWNAAMRELTETRGVGFIFMIGAKNRDELPTMFVQPEIVRRIGLSNYFELYNPAREDLRAFLLELSRTFIRKGAPPQSQALALGEAGADNVVPDELLDITGRDDARLDCFPLDPEALESLVNQLASSEFSNKPSEALDRLQKAAQRAISQDKRTIDVSIVEGIGSEYY
jgi:hypothetical protein